VALQVATSGIRVNAVAPGATDTATLTRFIDRRGGRNVA
jgi:NAD(P)-dependent dehydrogenase (short-subunit alcohol dehydrogenase family)